jgi:glyoxylase-like metal-dependent hydrolase (beta-lactamase superfamily II)
MIHISDNVHLYQDTCNVYVIHYNGAAVLIDFGSGDILDHLATIGVAQVNAILMTHHHRDQGQGLYRAQQQGIPIFVPHTEQELFDAVDEHWVSRQIKNNYNLREDRFSLLHSVSVTDTLKDYQTYIFGGLSFKILPTPGHTTGSITILTELDGRTFSFVGDLIADSGKIWSLAATQWGYAGAEGIPYIILSLLDLKDYRPTMLLPSHGQAMNDPNGAIDLLVERLFTLMSIRRSPDKELEMRSQMENLHELRRNPFERISSHLLRNRTSFAYSYVLLSQSGKALLIDYGYDFFFGQYHTNSGDRASRRPWLYNLKKLKDDFGVQKIDVILPTHYHDDHVAGCNLLRSIEGTQVWAAENFADILSSPDRYDLPCLWYDPIPVDRVIPLNHTIQWEEYKFTLYELPGHTLYAVAISFEVDGNKVLAVGDQHANDPFIWNYAYQNGFRYGDYVRSSKLYAELQPDLILTGHWDPMWVTQEHMRCLANNGIALERIHRDLLPTEYCDFEAGGFAAKIYPYQSFAVSGGKLEFTVEIRNPLSYQAEAFISVVTPDGWIASPNQASILLDTHTKGTLSFELEIPSDTNMFRERIAVDLTVGELRLGQQAEALITVR